MMDEAGAATDFGRAVCDEACADTTGEVVATLPCKTFSDIVDFTNTARGIEGKPRLTAAQLDAITGVDAAARKDVIFGSRAGFPLGREQLATLAEVFSGVPARLQHFVDDGIYQSAADIMKQIQGGKFESTAVYEAILAESLRVEKARTEGARKPALLKRSVC